jgi:hypothetical protein
MLTEIATAPDIANSVATTKAAILLLNATWFISQRLLSSLGLDACVCPYVGV